VIRLFDDCFYGFDFADVVEKLHTATVKRLGEGCIYSYISSMPKSKVGGDMIQ